MTVKELADKLKKFNAEKCDIDWLLEQPTVETAILTACKVRLEVVMRLVAPSAWKKYLRLQGPAWAEYLRTTEAARAEYERIKDAAWAEYEGIKDAAWAEYEGIRATARIELLEALETL